tara:strand:+ start:100 stop:645 length:546 start_codon:yes stop_codon:yes gene_type:complete
MNSTRARVIGIAAPAYSKETVKKLRKSVEEDERLEAYRTKLKSQTASEAYREAAAAHAKRIARGEESRIDVKLDFLAAELTVQVEQIEEAQRTGRNKVQTIFPEIAKAALEAVTILRTARADAEQRDADAFGVPFEPSNVLQAIQATERWLGESLSYSPAATVHQDRPLSISLRGFLPKEN